MIFQIHIYHHLAFDIKEYLNLTPSGIEKKQSPARPDGKNAGICPFVDTQISRRSW